MYKLGVTNITQNPIEEKITSELKSNEKIKDKQKLKDACEKFEAVFLEKLWQEMKKSVSSEGLFQDPLNNKYVELFDYEFCLKMAQNRGIGLANYLYNNLVQRLEQKSSETMFENKKIDNLNTSKKVDTNFSSKSSHTINENEDLTDIINDLAVKIENQDHSKDDLLPVQGTISSTFGFRRDPFLKDIRWHNGIDIAAPKGAPIKSVIAGEVIFSGKKDGYGNVVIISDKNGVKTIYAHNEKNLVTAGEKIDKGDVIALVGDSGRSTGPHLHFELRINDKPIDPMNFLYTKYAKNLNTPHEGA